MNVLMRPKQHMSATTCRWINYVDVMDCEDLQARVVTHLSPEELRLFFYPRLTAFRDNALKNGDAIVGCFDDGQLVGQAILLRNNTGEKFAQNYMLERPIPAILKDRSSAVITNAMVEPAYHGHGAMQASLDFISKSLRMFDAEAAFYITHVNNTSMIVAGLRSGYRMMDVGICRNNGEPMYLMVRQPMLAAMRFTKEAEVDMTADSYIQIQDYLSDGWIGCGMQNKKLLLQSA